MLSPYILSKIEKVIVTGACGFIGSHVVEALLEAGLEVMGIDNFSTGRGENLAHLKDKVRIENCDICHQIPLTGAFSSFKPDLVVHLAAQAAITTAKGNPQKDLTINGIGTLNVTRACARALEAG
jgi:UDP-glucose 4-epimerase